MTQTMEALFDGHVLLPDEELDLQTNTRVLITVQTLPVTKAPPRSFLDTARSMNLVGPPDWSENVDKYLYSDRNEPID